MEWGGRGERWSGVWRSGGGDTDSGARADGVAQGGYLGGAGEAGKPWRNAGDTYSHDDLVADASVRLLPRKMNACLCAR